MTASASNDRTPAEYVCYRATGWESVPEPAVPADYRSILWRPSWTSMMPPSFRRPTFAKLWWLMHWTRRFGNRDYCIAATYHGDALVHHTVAFPRYSRFPFMAADDLNLGEVWTDPAHRGRGLAVAALRRILVATRKPGREFWYVHLLGNEPSRRAALRVGFRPAGTNRKEQKWGSNVFAYYTFLPTEAGLPLKNSTKGAS